MSGQPEELSNPQDTEEEKVATLINDGNDSATQPPATQEKPDIQFNRKFYGYTKKAYAAVLEAERQIEETYIKAKRFR